MSGNTDKSVCPVCRKEGVTSWRDRRLEKSLQNTYGEWKKKASNKIRYIWSKIDQYTIKYKEK
jgi:hypothetical protein